MFTYRKVGGIHFVTLGRFGFSFYVRKAARRPVAGRSAASVAALARASA